MSLKDSSSCLLVAFLKGSSSDMYNLVGPGPNLVVNCRMLAAALDPPNNLTSKTNQLMKIYLQFVKSYDDKTTNTARSIMYV